MQLPESLKKRIEESVGGFKPADLANAASELSARYRSGTKAARFADSQTIRAAYLATRMPATFAVLSNVFDQLSGLSPRSLLDLGSGPGTALWAAAQAFEGLESATLCDSDPDMLRIGKNLVSGETARPFAGARWVMADLRNAPLDPHDLVVCSYSLGELGAQAASEVAQRAWKSAREALIVIEPGTIKGFSLIRELRGMLIASGAHIAAPCPHDHECPIRDGDWCHFAARIERTSLHRYLKTAEKGHEDEKFSYLIALKSPAPRQSARILRHPRHHSGFIRLKLCAAGGIEDLTITRSQKELWRKARKAKWGDEW
ncbi:MAG: small ribosomal subunit Rsm22 family protein [Blastocatellales bacterium]